MPGVRPVALEPHVLAEVGFVPHPEPLAQGDGCRVPRVELGVDAVQAEFAEREVEQQRRGLAGISPAL